MLKPEYHGKLVKLKRGKHRTLVVRGIKLSFQITRESDLTFRIRAKRGRLVSTWRAHIGPDLGHAHLPKRLLAGKRRLTKGHYVVGVTAKSGTATAAAASQLVVR